LAANAADVNIKDVSNYAKKSAKQVRAITRTARFSDVVPGDKTYSSLVKLSKSHSCVDSSYSRALKSGQSLTRYEAAALINQCIRNGIASENGQFSFLSKEFRTELAVIRGKIGVNEKAPSSFNAGQFSSSTKLNGEATYTLGTVKFETIPASETGEAVHLKYSYDLGLTTSFNGEDALVAGFETGNAVVTNLLQTESTVLGDDSGTIKLHSLYYTRPLGDFIVAAGPYLDQDDVFATTTSTYSNDFLFSPRYLAPNSISQHGLPGAGLAAAYSSDRGWNASASILTFNADDASAGMWTKEGYEYLTLAAGYDAENWGGGIVYSRIDDPEQLFEDLTDQTYDSLTFDNPVATGIGAYWNATPDFDISLGLDFVDPGVSGFEDATIWSVGADFDLGPGTLSGAAATAPYWNIDNAADNEYGKYQKAGYSFELAYDYPINDSISIKPGFYTTQHGETIWADHTVYALETTFKF